MRVEPNFNYLLELFGSISGLQPRFWLRLSGSICVINLIRRILPYWAIAPVLMLLSALLLLIPIMTLGDVWFERKIVFAFLSCLQYWVPFVVTLCVEEVSDSVVFFTAVVAALISQVMYEIMTFTPSLRYPLDEQQRGRIFIHLGFVALNCGISLYLGRLIDAVLYAQDFHLLHRLLYNVIFFGCIFWWWLTYSERRYEDIISNLFKHKQWAVVFAFAILKGLKNYTFYSLPGYQYENLLWHDIVQVAALGAIFGFHTDYDFWRGGTHVVFVGLLFVSSMTNVLFFPSLVSSSVRWYVSSSVLTGVAFQLLNSFAVKYRKPEEYAAFEKVMLKAELDPENIAAKRMRNGKLLCFISELLLLSSTI